MTEPSEGRVWLITGCSSGLGRSIARAALACGHRVAVTARDAAKVEDLVAAHPERSLALALDVTRKEQVASAVEATERRFGRIDVLVNNAGYGYLAAVEEGQDAEVRAVFETNYFGAIEMIKAVLPGMRSRRSGHIVNMSSVTGLVANPGVGYYASSKFALEGMSESLSKELRAFDIHVTLIEPGTFRTDWVRRSVVQTSTPIADYDETVGARRAMILESDGMQKGDPDRVADVVLRVTELPDPPLRMLVGRDVYELFGEKLEELRTSLSEWEAVTLDMEPPAG